MEHKFNKYDINEESKNVIKISDSIMKDIEKNVQKISKVNTKYNKITLIKSLLYLVEIPIILCGAILEIPLIMLVLICSLPFYGIRKLKMYQEKYLENMNSGNINRKLQLQTDIIEKKQEEKSSNLNLEIENQLKLIDYYYDNRDKILNLYNRGVLEKSLSEVCNDEEIKFLVFLIKEDIFDILQKDNYGKTKIKMKKK